MINLETENLLTLHDVPKVLPPRPNGRRIHISAIYRWVQRGVHGTRLEVIRLGGTTYTSREALQRFGTSPAISKTPLQQQESQPLRHIHQTSRCIQDIMQGRPHNN